MQYPIKAYFRAIIDRLKYGWQGRWQMLVAYVRRQPLWKLLLVGLGGPLAIALLIFGIIFLGIHFGWYGSLPTHMEIASIRNNQASAVYSADGALLGKYYVENRIDAELEEISPFVIDGLIATEDARFFEHSGIDLRALARVAWKSILLGDESSGGGSTISQQLAKNLFPRRRYRSLGLLKNKLREMIIAGRSEKVYNKEQLLLLYLNTVPFGDNSFGIKIAAERFFNKTAQVLSVEEAAVLVGLLKGNTSYNPRRHPEASRNRRNTVLRRMHIAGSLNGLDLDSLQALPLTLDFQPEAHNQGLATYFREHLRRELHDILAEYQTPGGQPYDLYRDGLRIYTTLDSRMQRHAEEAVTEQLPRIQANLAMDWRRAKSAPWEEQFQSHIKESTSYKNLANQGLDHDAILEQLRISHEMTILDGRGKGVVDTLMSPLDSLRHYFTLLNAGLLAIEPQTGLIRAWVGGIDHRFVQYDHVKSRRQVGSTIKPLVYAAALEEGMRPCEYTPAERFTYEDYNNYNPGNPNGKYEGVYSMRGGLAKSVNTVAVNIAVRTGLSKVAQKARSMGLIEEVKPIPSLALGTVEANLMEMVRVYAAFANSGRRPDVLHYLDRIETADGKVIVEFARPDQSTHKRVLPDSTATLATFLMAGVVNSGTGARLRSTYGLRGALAGKTGTTQDQSDGWFLGYTPKLVVGSWVGAEYPAVHFRTLSKGSATATALPVWGSFMRRVARDKELKAFQGGRFPSLDPMTEALLQCPDYLDEMPIFYQDSLRGDVRLREIDPARVEAMMQRKPRRRNESTDEYVARIERQLAKETRRDERREKRKAFWGGVLFGNKKDKPDTRSRSGGGG